MLKKSIFILFIIVTLSLEISAIPIGEVVIIDIPWILDANDDCSILVGGGGGGGQYWTEETGVVTISTTSSCSAISENGIIAGEEVEVDESTGCWWDIDELEPNFLGSVQADQTNSVNTINNDGSVIAGLQWYIGGMGSAKAYKWTPETGSILLPEVLDWSDSRADCCTPDGSLIGGYAAQERSIWRPVLWNETELIELPYVLDLWATVSAISPNGEWCSGYNGPDGIIWHNEEIAGYETEGPEFIQLHFRTVTDDGWAGGESANWNTQVAIPILWNPIDSLMNAIDFFEANGVTIPADYDLFRIRRISNDHLTYVCNGTDLNNYQYKSCILKILGPHSVSSFKAETEEYNNVHLTWNFDENTPGAQNVVILKNEVEITQLDPTITEYFDNDLDAGSYNYEIYVTYDVYDNSISRYANAEVVFNEPTDLAYSFEDVYNSLTLNWVAPAISRSLTGYQIYRNDSLLEEITNETTFLDSEIPNGIHTYKVRAVYSTEYFSEFSNDLEIWIANDAPLNLEGSLQGENSVDLSWESPNPENPNITGYQLYRNDAMIAELDVETVNYIDEDLDDGEYEYYVTAIYYDLFESEVSNLFNITIATVGTESGIIPLVTKLQGNYPNPFNPETTIFFSIKEPKMVTLEVYNIKGQKIRTLINKELSAGKHTVIWNGKNDLGKIVPSGIFFTKMITDDYQKIQKMIMLK